MQSPVYVSRGTAIWRGMCNRCPNCGKGRLFASYLKVRETCAVCSEELNHHRADDLPIYLTVAVLGHVLVGLVVWLELAYSPSYWIYGAVGIPFTLLLTLTLLHIFKGGAIALEWSLGLQGFQAAKLRRDALKPAANPTEIN